jgi:hypothetical protein
MCAAPGALVSVTSLKKLAYLLLLALILYVAFFGGA